MEIVSAFGFIFSLMAFFITVILHVTFKDDTNKATIKQPFDDGFPGCLGVSLLAIVLFGILGFISSSHVPIDPYANM
ncbi:MAG: hypothetical protein QM758_07740 [Armatimonas sp.]